MKDRGEPVRISRSELEQTEQDFKDVARKIDGPLNIPLLSTPDHVLEARGDCSITFIEEGLLPLVRDNVLEISTQEVIEMAEEFMAQFRKDHPNDFDLDDPLDLVAISEVHLLPLTILYIVKGKRSVEDQKLSNLIGQASDLLDRVLGEFFPDDEDEIPKQ